MDQIVLEDNDKKETYFEQIIILTDVVPGKPSSNN
jgi:hypothetical protein